MSEVKHTPTPWEYEDGDISSVEAGAVICAVLQHHDFPCVDDEDRAATQAECDANAAFIVRAVNSHAPMLAALNAAAGYLLNAKIDLETGAKKATAIATIEGGLRAVRAAIAAAGDA